MLVGATPVFTNLAGGSVTGGAGGAGGFGYWHNGSRSIGVGGLGGAGVEVSGATAATLVNAGTITGGAAHVGDGAGLGGVGVYGANVSIRNSGLIAGGAGGLGQGYALSFASGLNNLTTNAGGAYTGAINIASGATLTLAQTAAAGSTGSVNYSAAGMFTGAGALRIAQDGGHAITLSGDNSGFTGETTVLGASRLNLSHGLGAGSGGITLESGLTQAAAGRLVVASGVSVSPRLNMLENSTVDLLGGSTLSTVIVTGDPIFNVTGSNSVGSISGAGDVVVLGTGGGAATDILTMTGASTYTLATTVGDGTVGKGVTLRGGAANAFSAVSATAVNAFGVLDLGGFDQTVSSLSGAGGVTNSGAAGATLTNQGLSSSFSGRIQDGAGATSLTQNAAGQTLTLNGVHTYTGATNITAGVLAVGAGGVLSAASATTVAGTLDLGATTQDVASLTLAGGVIRNGGLSNAAGLSSLGGSLSDLTVTGVLTATAGVTTLTGVNRFAGILNGAGASIVNNGTTFDDLNNAGLYTNNATQTAVVAANSGVIDNTTGATWNGNVNGPNTGAIFNRLGATWNGDVAIGANAAGGLIDNAGAWNGTANIGAGALNNVGTWTGAIVNAGTFVNAGSVSGLVTNAGTFVNAALAQVQGGLLNTAGTATNAGTIFGGATINGGTLTTTGQIAGDLVNAATVNAQGVISGGVRNAGAFVVTGALDGATGDFANGSNLTIGGALSGAGTVHAALDLAAGKANTITVHGPVSGVSLDIALSGQGGATYFRQVTLANLNGGGGFQITPATSAALANASRGGFYDYRFAATQGGQGVVQTPNASIATSTLNQFASTLTAMNLSMFSSATPFLAPARESTPNRVEFKFWNRDAVSNTSIPTTLALAGDPATARASRTSTRLAGFQFGADLGLFNVQNLGLDAHLGVTGGAAFASSSERNNPGVSSRTEIPFGGVYAALTGKGFTGTVALRYDSYQLTLNNAAAGVNHQKINGHGLTVSGDLRYAIPLGRAAFLEPSVGLQSSRANLSDQSFAFGVNRFEKLDSTLGRVGLRAGVSMQAGDIVLQPFAAINLFREWAGDAQTLFTPKALAGAPAAAALPLTASRVGTFAQASLGLGVQSPGGRWAGYARADANLGGEVKGWGLTAGLRYNW